MEETESYLNTILKKRVNAVANPYGSRSRLPSRSKANTDIISRIPMTQERIEDIPTVFRQRDRSKKSITHHNSSSNLFDVQKSTFDNSNINKKDNEKRCSAQRKQFFLISKRISNKNEDGPVYLQNNDVTNLQTYFSNTPQLPIQIQNKIQPLQQKPFFPINSNVPIQNQDQPSKVVVLQGNNRPPLPPKQSNLPPLPSQNQQIKLQQKSQRRRKKIFQGPKPI